MLINESKEALSYIRLDIFAERWIVPEDISWTVLPRRQVTIITAFIEGFLVHGFGVVKAFSV